MKELALHILDIVQNSISAGASGVKVTVRENRCADRLEIEIEDNGRGMPAEVLNMVDDPFYTTRTTRKVGLGIPLLKHSALQAGGNLSISSVPGEGTRLTVTFVHSHIDRPPLGDIAGVISSLAGMNPGMVIGYRHEIHRKEGKREYGFETREVMEILGDIPLSEPAVILFLKEMIYENIMAME
jgi:anti-sigma regulatory factor (Ser/Thr protein kinase)